MAFTIYQLIDPRDNQPRYVGYTEDFVRRQRDYVSGPPHSKNLLEWFAELHTLNFQPLMVPLEMIEGTVEKALQREAYWIKKLIDAGAVLLNAQGNSTKQERKKTTVLLHPKRVKWLKIQAALKHKEMSEIVEEALALWEKVNPS